jgi:hypothetical protein
VEQQQEAKAARDLAQQMTAAMQQDSSSRMTVPAMHLTTQTAVAAAVVTAAAVVRVKMTAAQMKMMSLVRNARISCMSYMPRIVQNAAACFS